MESTQRNLAAHTSQGGKQQESIEDLQARVAAQQSKGHDIVFVDQCVYSLSSVGAKLKPAAGRGKYVAQMVGASTRKGVVHHELLVGRSYKGEDVRHFL